MKMNWQLKKLGEVCKFVSGSQPPKTAFSLEKKEGYIRLIQIRDYKSDNHIVYIPQSLARRFCNENEIMIGRYGPPVFQILKGLNGAYNVALMKAIPNEKLLSADFLFVFLKYSKIQDYIIHLSQRAAGQTGVNKEALEAYPIPIPPLAEQQRIVAVLDKTFAAIAQANENAEKNLQNVRELFDSYLQSVFDNPGDCWEEKSLGEVYDVRDGTHDSPKYQETGFALITSKNLKKDELNYNKVQYISEEDYKKINQRSKVHKGDILFAMIGTIGNPVVIDIEPDFAIKNVALFKIPTAQSNYFLKYYLDSKLVINKILREAKGTTQKFVGLGYLRDFKILLPPFIEQQKIVIKLDAISIETKKLENIYRQKISDLDELKKSILQKAFSGEL